MSNISITQVVLGSVILESGAFRDDTLTVAAAGTVKAGTILARDSVTGKLVVFEKGGSTNENGIPKAVLTYDVIADAAGDVAIRDMVSGSVRAPLLVIAADGDASNVDDAVMDQLRDYCILTIDVTELCSADNQ